ncbi:hypothetical protein CHUAL_012004 [Chamberlinius hualienensis]
METYKRRLSCPLTVQYIWNSIESLSVQKQTPDIDHIYEILNREYNMTLGDVERQLKYAVRDDLISIVNRNECKVNRKSFDCPESYWLPDQKQERDGHDWYCFECHRSGEVVCCGACFRVFHPYCIKDDVSSLERFICPICKMLMAECTFKIAKEDLNVLLGYTCNRLKEKPLKSFTKHSIQNEEGWRRNCLIYCYVDLIIMEEKAAKQLYNRIEEYQVDSQTLVHNIVVFYGIHSAYADYAKQLLADCIYDLSEILQCKDCYRVSNEKLDKFWFCQPCTPPHELVYAKQRGYPYWPAKVIKKDRSVYDVRFFGGLHQRANVEKEYIKPISTKIQSLNIKRSAGWIKAMEELKRHTTMSKKLSLGRVGSNIHAGAELRIESDDDNNEPQAKCPIVNLIKLSDVETIFRPAEHVSSLTGCIKKEKYKFNSDLDGVNVVSSSSQEPGSIQHRNIAIQTGNWSTSNKFSKCNQTVSDPPCAINKQVIQMKEKLEYEFHEAKETALHELSLDKKHYEDHLCFVNAEKEKLKQLENRLNEKYKQEIATLNTKHQQAISEAKKKQWCWVCENEAKYYCCWNTSYCSVDCQLLHWNDEHKQVCRRQRS